MKYLKLIKGHHIAKAIVGFVFYITFVYMIFMIKILDQESTNPVYTTEINGLFDHMSFGVAKLTHYTNYFALNNSEGAIMVYLLLGVVLMVYLMDITAGVGRSRTQERYDKKQKEYYNIMNEREKSVKIFFEEVEKGDYLQTDKFGIQKVIDIDIDDHSVIIENGLNFYPNDDDSYTYIIK